MEFEASGNDPVDTDADPVITKMAYRNRLKTELATVVPFPTLAVELLVQSQLIELDAWLCDTTEPPVTLL